MDLHDDFILIACTTGTVGNRPGGLIGPDWPWVALAGTPDVCELWDADPEELAEQLAEHRLPACGGVWVGRVILDGDRVEDVPWWRAATDAEWDAFCVGQLAAAMRRPPPDVQPQHRWLVGGRL